MDNSTSKDDRLSCTKMSGMPSKRRWRHSQKTLVTKTVNVSHRSHSFSHSRTKPSVSCKSPISLNDSPRSPYSPLPDVMNGLEKADSLDVSDDIYEEFVDGRDDRDDVSSISDLQSNGGRRNVK